MKPCASIDCGGARTIIPDEDGIVISTVDKLRSVLVDEEGSALHEALTRSATIGAIVVDEAHRAEAPSYRRVLQKLGIEFSGGSTRWTQMPPIHRRPR